MIEIPADYALAYPVADTRTYTFTVPMATTPRALGVDISKYQGEMDFDVCQQAGAQFVIARCGGGYLDSGVPFTDDRWLENHAKLIAKGNLPWTAYWYFIPANVQAQATRLIELIQLTDYWMPIQIDCEKWWSATAAEQTRAANAGGIARQVCIAQPGSKAVQLSPSGASDKLQEFLALLSDAGIDTGLYTRGSFWNVYYEARTVFSERDLWVARYSSTLDHPWGDGNYQPNGWDDWRFWQWSADGNGRGHEFGASSNAIDIDYFNGTPAQFDAWIGIDTGEYPYLVRVTNENNSVLREYPAGGRYLGVAMLGDMLGVLERDESADGAVWLRVGVDRWLREGHTVRV
jgi:GH25 family lysozyme M1 (1,4-beta-N-acetylmuramidase)